MEPLGNHKLDPDKPKNSWAGHMIPAGLRITPGWDPDPGMISGLAWPLTLTACSHGVLHVVERSCMQAVRRSVVVREMSR